MKEYTLPAMFTNDWANRCTDWDEGEAKKRWVRDGSRTVVVRLTDAEVADLLADARYYGASNSDGWWDESTSNLRNSAKRVVARLEQEA